MINTINPLISSLSQSICDCVETLLEEFKSIEPSFNYRLSFATDYDDATPNNVFDIVLQIGAIDRLPTHYTKVGEKTSILFAGITDVGLSIVAPIAKTYSNNVQLTEITQQEISPDFLDTKQSNYLSGDNDFVFDTETLDKIQNTSRLLEALSMFMYRKGMVSNDFELTFTTNIPEITGQLEYGIYRLVEEIYIKCKFQQISDFYVSSGENVMVKFNVGTDENPNWLNYYNIVDFSFGFSAVDQSYPVSPRAIVQNQINQLESKLTISSPAVINIGASKYFSECFEKGQLERLQFITMRYSEDNGKTWKETQVNVNTLEYPRNVDTFGSFVFTLSILKPIEVI